MVRPAVGVGFRRHVDSGRFPAAGQSESDGEKIPRPIRRFTGRKKGGTGEHSPVCKGNLGFLHPDPYVRNPRQDRFLQLFVDRQRARMMVEKEYSRFLHPEISPSFVYDALQQYIAQIPPNRKAHPENKIGPNARFAAIPQPDADSYGTVSRWYRNHIKQRRTES